MLLENKQCADVGYRAVIESMANGFAYCKIVTDAEGRPVDIIFLDMNPAFEKHMGLIKKTVLGKRITEVIPGFFERKNDLLNLAAKAALTGESSEWEFYMDSSNKWFSMSLSGVQKEFFSAILYDITNLRLKYENLRKILDTSPDLIVVTDLQGSITDCNNKALEVFGAGKKEDLMGTDALDLFVSTCRDQVRDDMAKILSTGSSGNRIYKFLGANGREFTGEMSVNLFRDHRDNSVGYIGIAKDITVHIKMKEALEASEAKLRSIISSSPDSITVCDMDGVIMDCNQQTLNLLDFASKEDLIGKNFFDFVLYPDRSKASESMKKLLASGIVKHVEYAIRTRKKRELIVDASSGLVCKPSGEIDCIVTILNDISERKKAESEIKYLSYHDKLTGLYNRAFFEEELARLDSQRQLPVSLIIGDLNGLKLTNDVFGHSEGDRLLVKVAAILKRSCRTKDIIARWGGDEFAIILPSTSNKTAMDICDRITRFCSEAEKYPIQPSIALGYATKETASQDIDQVIKEAENWMYRHKLLDNRSVRSSVISSLQKTLFERSYETEEHAKRMQLISMKLGKALGLSNTEMDELSLLSILHDIGKIAIPDSILIKPGKLTHEEWAEMKKHPEIGYRIAQSSHELSYISEYILYHHEHWDGTGYPRGLRGNAIPRLARIIAIVDAYDVMTHARPYKGIMNRKEAVDEIKKCSGTQFDPEIAQVFIRLIEGMDEV
ncbi:MAG: PAS domain S-box protein [Clostridiales bacterium]|nr:PAS domain S-box protein [Eubacteriales bacterium]MDH7566699.1 PAS domain S-box protein [Clostridiales bacterium]